ncbi:MAG: flagellar biosynthesis protein FliQ [Bacillota bacterium]|nr:flagellar biosynthesis protein FliQ [Bacillota bacterium]
MNSDLVFDIFNRAIGLILITSAPMMIAALVVGLIISIFQATTQIQEQTLAFVPKIIVIFLVLILTGPWIITSLVEYTEELFNGIVDLMILK